MSLMTREHKLQSVKIHKQLAVRLTSDFQEYKINSIRFFKRFKYSQHK